MPKGTLISIAMLIVILIAAVAVVSIMLQKEQGGPARPSPINSIQTSGLVTAELPASGDRIVINAADYNSIEGPIEVVEDTALAGGKGLYLADTLLGKPAKLSAIVTYKFSVKKAGTYRLWIRHWWQDECGNSLFVIVDDGPQMLFGDDGTANVWRWPPALKMTLELTEGEHTLTIIPREDGMKFDQILLTTDLEYYPVNVLSQ
ncbi:MAG: hypothetical protein Kow00107_06550 [Planctomycetota bacterium]